MNKVPDQKCSKNKVLMSLCFKFFQNSHHEGSLNKKVKNVMAPMNAKLPKVRISVVLSEWYSECHNVAQSEWLRFVGLLCFKGFYVTFDFIQYLLVFNGAFLKKTYTMGL